MIRSVVLGMALILCSVGLASAHTVDEQAACKDDAFRICPNAIPDRERVLQCVIANRDAGSPHVVRCSRATSRPNRPARPSSANAHHQRHPPLAPGLKEKVGNR